VKNILLICDKPNWAYASIAKSLIKYNDNGNLALDIAYIKGNSQLQTQVKRYDSVFVLGWQIIADLRWWGIKNMLPFLDISKVLTGVHSHHSWDNRATTPDNNTTPPRKLVKYLNKCRAVNAVSQRLYELFKRAGVHNIAYTPNGVDTNIFQPIKPLRRDGKLRVGYSGSLKHDWRKGITQFIEPACKIADVNLVKAMPTEEHYVPLDEMPGFYNDIDIYLCASSSEGFSLSVLEASACGRPVISTRVGGSEDLIIDGQNGFLVDRDVKTIADKIKKLDRDRDLLAHMGKQNRNIIEKNWSWSHRGKDWLYFMTSDPTYHG